MEENRQMQEQIEGVKPPHRASSFVGIGWGCRALLSWYSIGHRVFFFFKFCHTQGYYKYPLCIHIW